MKAIWESHPDIDRIWADMNAARLAYQEPYEIAVAASSPLAEATRIFGIPVVVDPKLSETFYVRTRRIERHED